MDATWIPLLEYALKHRISVSTLRRHIKLGKVQFKLARGKYLIAHDSTASSDDAPATWLGDNDAEAARLRLELRQAQEEIAELKTLIALYEERAPERTPKIGRC